MQQLIEEIKPIKGYEGLYEISNYGYAISLPKEWICGNGTIRKKEETVFKAALNRDGYLQVNLRKNGKQKSFKIHILVWDHFGIGKRNGHKLQVDHKDENKQNPRIDNLQLLSNRQNIVKYHRTQKHSSKYTGVHWNKRDKKWIAQITINKNCKYLGCFIDEYAAHLRYEEALRKI